MKKQHTNFFNRELSWLEFNQRVLDLATQESTPLLERVKFLAITASNLDEFFMVRVGGLRLVETRSGKTDAAGFSSTEQLELIRQRVLKMNADQAECLSQQLEPLLAEQGIVRLSPADLDSRHQEYLLSCFQDEILSTIAPLAVDPLEGFPLLTGARLCVCVRLKNITNSKLSSLDKSSPDSLEDVADQQADRFLLLPLGKDLKRIWPVPAEQGYHYMLVEDLIGMFLGHLFKQDEIIEWTSMRITRNGDIAMDEDGQADLLADMYDLLEARTTADCVRLEISASASETMKQFLQQCTGSDDRTVYPINGPLALTDYFGLASIQGFQALKETPWDPQRSPDFSNDECVFDIISSSDRMLYHPYQSYDPVVNFLKAAAEDPNVIAIKQTLYRTGSRSDIVSALETAAKNGKHVTVIVELKARFDEARNIHWARHLEKSGVDVIYGVRGLKTHAKVCIVVRREPAGIRRYMHFGTGNYNESTARLYSDVSLFTCDEQLGTDAVHLFNAITGLSVPQPFNRLAAAPINLREKILELIKLEAENAKRDVGGQIMAKMNSLVDPEIINALYEASQAGVKIRLNIRGICCLIPGVKNLSENIRVVSIVDRFLEHARIFHFKHAGENQLYISSADWMGRNLDRRVELLVPVNDPDCRARLTQILKCYFDDNVSSRELHSDGHYAPVNRKKKKKDFQSQPQLHEEACQLYASQHDPKTTVFQPHRAIESQ